MARRPEYTAYVFPYRVYDDPHERGRLVCSPSCGNNLLAYPPECWEPFRVRVARQLAIAVTCECCGFTLSELREMEERS